MMIYSDKGIVGKHVGHKIECGKSIKNAPIGIYINCKDCNNELIEEIPISYSREGHSTHTVECWSAFGNVGVYCSTCKTNLVFCSNNTTAGNLQMIRDTLHYICSQLSCEIDILTSLKDIMTLLSPLIEEVKELEDEFDYDDRAVIE